MAKTAIQWTDVTWNPVTGCSKVSPGCAHCYAESLTRRFATTWGVPDLPWTPENAAENVMLHPERLDQPLRWKRPRMVFVNSMSDLFHEQVPDEFIAAIYSIMYEAHRHTFQVLTKRPERMAAMVGSAAFIEQVQLASERRAEDPDEIYVQHDPWPPRNVWLGVSIENRRYVNRADLLRETPAAVRFISAEPLLGPLLTPQCVSYVDRCCQSLSPNYGGACRRCPNRRRSRWEAELNLTDIDWLIVGGESGQGHRPMKPEWVRDLRNSCQHSRHLYDPNTDQRGPGTAFFFKQWGGRTPKAGGRELDGRTWDEMPAVAR